MENMHFWCSFLEINIEILILNLQNYKASYNKTFVLISAKGRIWHLVEYLTSERRMYMPEGCRGGGKLRVI